jgi:hypothetical protein
MADWHPAMARVREEHRRAIAEQIERDLPTDVVNAFEAWWAAKDHSDSAELDALANFVASWAFVAGWCAHRDATETK